MLKGINWVAVVIAVVLLEGLGFVWYGILFVDAWTEAMRAAGMPPNNSDVAVMQSIGAVNTLVIVVGLSWLTNRLGATTLLASVGTALAAWFFFDLTTQALDYLYMGMPLTVVEINIGYQVVAYALTGAVIALVKFGRPKAR